MKHVMPLRTMGLTAGAFLLMAHGAGADVIVPTVAPATVTGQATACGPCGGAYSATAAQGDVPLAEYGVNYNITSFIPSLQQSGVSTPGELTVSVGGATATEKLTTTDPSFTATVSGSTAVESPAFYSEGLVATGTSFDYYFKVIDPSDPTSTADTTVHVTSTGGVNIATSAFPGSYGSFNNGNALAELLISPHSGVTTLEEIAQGNYGYYAPSGATNDSTSNVTATIGPSSSASGAFTLTALPVTVQLDTQYEVSLIVAITGSYVVNGSAYVDPIITSPGDDLFFSPGIGNVVPEPSTWAMLLLGFAGLGFLGFKRARKAGLAV